VVPAASDEHDLAVARISHLPHLFAAVLAAVGAAGSGDEGALALSLAASSFADGTRVAGTRPELVLAMCEGNRDALLAAVDDALGRLGAMRGALASTGGLAATVRAGYDSRARWAAAQQPEGVRVRLSGRAPLARLRDVGRAGKVVTGWA
jgi:prephenate dehydrogenase